MKTPIARLGEIGQKSTTRRQQHDRPRGRCAATVPTEVSLPIEAVGATVYGAGQDGDPSTVRRPARVRDACPRLVASGSPPTREGAHFMTQSTHAGDVRDRTNEQYLVTQSYGAKSIETKPGREGLRVIYRRGRSKRIYVRGYYDTMVGMEGIELSLGEFCHALGITAKDVQEALSHDPA
jgi:hypothetical protein